MTKFMKFPRMKIIFCASIITIIVGFMGMVLMVLSTSSSSNLSSLKFVIVVTRHGARSPLFTFPTDLFPYPDTKHWPEGKGLLTTRGKQQMYKMGQTLRQRYGQLFNFTYKFSEVYARSTAIVRTYMSGALLLAGMFPPEGINAWHPDINWQPIPIWTDIFDKSKIITNRTACPRFTLEQSKRIRESVSYIKDNHDFFSYLEDHTRTDIPNLYEYMNVWDPIACEDEHELPLPSWIKSIYPEKMSEVTAKMFETTVYGNTIMNRLLSGPLIKDFNSWISRKMNDEVREKMLFHSGHDFTISGLMSALGFKQISIIKPAATIVFELHKTPVHANYQIKMLYFNSSETEEPLHLNMPKCKDPCLASTFLKALQEMETEDDWDSECRYKN